MTWHACGPCDLHLDHSAAWWKKRLRTTALRQAVFTLILRHKTILRRKYIKPLTWSRAQLHARAVFTNKVHVSIWNWKQPSVSEVHILNLYPLHSKPHKWWLRSTFARKIPMGETAHFKCNIKQSARLSQHILCNEARECPCNSLQPFRTLWKIILRKVRVVYVCEELEASRIRVFLKQTQSHLTSRIVGERIAMHRWIDFFFSHP